MDTQPQSFPSQAPEGMNKLATDFPVVGFNRNIGETCWIIIRNKVRQTEIVEINASRTIEGDEVKIKLKNLRKSRSADDIFFSIEAVKTAFFNRNVEALEEDEEFDED